MNIDMTSARTELTKYHKTLINHTYLIEEALRKLKPIMKNAQPQISWCFTNVKPNIYYWECFPTGNLHKHMASIIDDVCDVLDIIDKSVITTTFETRKTLQMQTQQGLKLEFTYDISNNPNCIVEYKDVTEQRAFIKCI
jgi:hypothetical protein